MIFMEHIWLLEPQSQRPRPNQFYSTFDLVCLSRLCELADNNGSSWARRTRIAANDCQPYRHLRNSSRQPQQSSESFNSVSDFACRLSLRGSPQHRPMGQLMSLSCDWSTRPPHPVQIGGVQLPQAVVKFVMTCLPLAQAGRLDDTKFDSVVG